MGRGELRGGRSWLRRGGGVFLLRGRWVGGSLFFWFWFCGVRDWELGLGVEREWQRRDEEGI